MSTTRAHLLLFVAAALWGFGNVAQKTVLEHLDPISVVGLRCLIGAALVAPLMLAERGGPPGPGWIASLLRVCGLFAAAILVQQVAYLGTTVSNASFLVNTATVITPLAAWMMLRERPGGSVLAAAGLTLGRRVPDDRGCRSIDRRRRPGGAPVRHPAMPCGWSSSAGTH